MSAPSIACRIRRTLLGASDEIFSTFGKIDIVLISSAPAYSNGVTFRRNGLARSVAAATNKNGSWKDGPQAHQLPLAVRYGSTFFELLGRCVRATVPTTWM